jgi:hypothetical protein
MQCAIKYSVALPVIACNTLIFCMWLSHVPALMLPVVSVYSCDKNQNSLLG